MIDIALGDCSILYFYCHCFECRIDYEFTRRPYNVILGDISITQSLINNTVVILH